MCDVAADCAVDVVGVAVASDVAVAVVVNVGFCIVAVAVVIVTAAVGDVFVCDCVYLCIS